MAHADATPPRFDLTAFPMRPQPQRVWHSADGAITVDTVQVHKSRSPAPSAPSPNSRRGPPRPHSPDPAPADAAGAALFEADVRHGGYHGQVTVGQDLTRMVVGATQAMRLQRHPAVSA